MFRKKETELEFCINKNRTDKPVSNVKPVKKVHRHGSFLVFHNGTIRISDIVKICEYSWNGYITRIYLRHGHEWVAKESWEEVFKALGGL